MTHPAIDYLDLCGGIYAAALDPAAMGAFVERLARAAGAETCTVVTTLPDGRMSHTAGYGLEPEAMTAYDAYFNRLDRLLPSAGDLPVAFTPSAFEHLWRGYLQSEFFCDWSNRYKCEQIAFVTVSSPVVARTTLLLGSSAQDRRFGSQAQLSLLGRVAPHFAKTLALQERLARLQRTNMRLLETLEQWPFGVIVLDASGRPTRVTAKAEQSMREGGGLRVAHGRVRASDADTDRALRQLIDGILGHGDPASFQMSCVSVRSSVRPHPLVVHGIPLGACGGDGFSWLSVGDLAALLIIVDPNRDSRPTSDALRSTFGLTKAEASVALHVMDGHGLGAVASKLGVAPSTVRSHLLNVFDKTSTSRQAELVRLLVVLCQQAAT
jgi:DNA-binding CsgD family transcriptional regulator